MNFHVKVLSWLLSLREHSIASKFGNLFIHHEIWRNMLHAIPQFVYQITMTTGLYIGNIIGPIRKSQVAQYIMSYQLLIEEEMSKKSVKWSYLSFSSINLNGSKFTKYLIAFNINANLYSDYNISFFFLEIHFQMYVFIDTPCRYIKISTSPSYSSWGWHIGRQNLRRRYKYYTGDHGGSAQMKSNFVWIRTYGKKDITWSPVLSTRSYCQETYIGEAEKNRFNERRRNT